MDIIEKIKHAKLTNVQIKIASYITSDLRKTAFLSGNEIAEVCNTSVAAVTRFSKNIGYSGFTEMKKALEDLYRKQNRPYDKFESYANEYGEESIFENSFKQDLDNMYKLSSTVNKELIEKVCKDILKSSHVYVVGIGVSEIVVDILVTYLNSFEKSNTSLKSFGVSKKAEIINFKKNELVICISFQRILKEVREVAEIARSKKAKVISITDSETNPLALESDLAIVAPVNGLTFGMSMIAPIAVVNIIGNSYAMIDKSNNLQKIKIMQKSWNRLPIFCTEV